MAEHKGLTETATGGFEAPSGHSPSPPPSPGRRQRRRSGDAACNITEECERLFCETLKTVFLVEKDAGFENSLVMDTHDTTTMTTTTTKKTEDRRLPMRGEVRRPAAAAAPAHDLPTPSPSPDGRIIPRVAAGLVREYVEVFDYREGAVFRGFVAEGPATDERALFVFFDHETVGKDLKPGLMALLELASSDALECDQLVACVDRLADEEDAEEVVRSLGWVGFELTMLDAWAGGKNCVSDRWLSLGLDL